MHLASTKSIEAEEGSRGSPPPWDIEAALLTGGFDRHYAFGLAMGLVTKGVRLTVIGSDEVDSPEMHTTPRLTFLNLQGSRAGGTSLANRVYRVLAFYGRLCRYAAFAKPRVFHILWNNKLEYLDRTVLMLYFKVILRKNVVLTAHNVNTAKRDSNDSFLNRITLKAQYRLADHIFVHTEKMKAELVQDFGVSGKCVSVIQYGINNSVPDTALTTVEAKKRLGLARDEKVILFFGAIRPYKGLERLVAAFGELAPNHPDYRLIIAGERKKGSEKYLDNILASIACQNWRDRVISKIEFVPDEETELYFKAADVLVLPYIEIYQSGVLFLSYSFGLPVVATDLGSFREDIVEGENGFVCEGQEARDIAAALERYFSSDLFHSLEQRRSGIREKSSTLNSWDLAAETTCNVYSQLLAAR